MTVIVDGTGKGYRAAVNSDNKILVDSVSEDAYVHAAENGRAFNINTKAIAYSGTGPYTAGCLYLKNNGLVTLEIVGFFIGEANNRVGGSTTDPILFEMYGNPTGTITGTDVAAVNRRIGDSRDFNLDCLSEPTGYTVSGDPLLYQYSYGSRSFGTVNFSIPPGQSVLLQANIPSDTVTFYTGFTGYIGDD